MNSTADQMSDEKLVTMYRNTRGVLKILENEMRTRGLLKPDELLTNHKAGVLVPT